MKENVVVITGSSRGIGFAMASEFLKKGNYVVISGKSQKNLKFALKKLDQYKKKIFGIPCDVMKYSAIKNLWDKTIKKFGHINIWINNAGISQPFSPLWKISKESINDIVQTNILGLVNGSIIAMNGMLKQGYGFIYNMEGWGSNGKHRNNLNLYGMTKRAVRYFSNGLSEEANKTRVRISTISPGITMTDFILEPLKKNPQRLNEAKKLFNILGELPETPAKFLVTKILKNKKNGANFQFLTGPKAFFKFLLAPFNKRDFFKDLI